MSSGITYNMRCLSAKLTPLGSSDDVALAKGC